LTLLSGRDENTFMAAVPRITKEELKQRLEDNRSTAPVLVDVRLKYPFEHSTVRLPGAIRMLPSAIDPTQLPRDREVVLYDSDPEELVSARIAQDLIRGGYRVRVLEGGIAAWVNAKFPTESKPAPQLAVPITGSLKG
jgi:3-mercaptopyruvate sulfurtransferase SseA